MHIDQSRHDIFPVQIIYAEALFFQYLSDFLNLFFGNEISPLCGFMVSVPSRMMIFFGSMFFIGFPLNQECPEKGTDEITLSAKKTGMFNELHDGNERKAHLCQNQDRGICMFQYKIECIQECTTEWCGNEHEV